MASDEKTNADADAEVTMMAVHTKYHRQGVGNALMTELLKIVRQNYPDCKQICLNTQKEENLKFYAKFGFILYEKENSRGFDTWKMENTFQ